MLIADRNNDDRRLRDFAVQQIQTADEGQRARPVAS